MPLDAGRGAVEIATRLALETEAYDPPLCWLSPGRHPHAGDGLEIRVGVAPEQVNSWAEQWGLKLGAGEGLVLLDRAPDAGHAGGGMPQPERSIVWVTGVEPSGVWRAAAALAWAWPEALGWDGWRPIRRAGALKDGTTFRQPMGQADDCSVALLPPLPGGGKVRWFRVREDGWIDALGADSDPQRVGRAPTPEATMPSAEREAGGTDAGSLAARPLDLFFSHGGVPRRLWVPVRPILAETASRHIWSGFFHPSFLNLFGLPGPQGHQGLLDREAADMTAHLATGADPEHLIALCELTARTALDALGIRFPLTAPPRGHEAYGVDTGTGATRSETLPGFKPATGAWEPGLEPGSHSTPPGHPSRSLVIWTGPGEDDRVRGPTVRWDGGCLAVSGAAGEMHLLASMFPYWPATGRSRGETSQRDAAVSSPAAGLILQEVEANLSRLAAGRVPFLALSGSAASEGGSLSGDPEPFTWTYERALPWEVDRARAFLESAVYPRLGELEEPVIEVFLSEPRMLRSSLHDEITRRARSAKATGVGDAVTIRVLSAWKAGYHWVSEEVIPDLVRFGASDVKRLEMGWEWVVPDERYLDLPIRWLQELYPSDEVIASETGIPLENIFLKRCGDSGLPHYHVRAVGAGGATIGRWQAGFPVSIRRYIGDPSRSFRMISAGVRLYDGERLVVETTFPTDLEAVWEVFEGEVLPQLWSRCQEGTERLLHLDVHVDASEEEEAPSVGEESLSALEALHEDIYFGTLDFWELRSREAGLSGSSPGSVRPWMTPAVGSPPRLRVHAVFAAKAQSEPAYPRPGQGPGAASANAGAVPSEVPGAVEGGPPYGAMLDEVRLSPVGSSPVQVEARVRLRAAPSTDTGDRAATSLLERMAGWARRYVDWRDLQGADVTLADGALLLRFSAGLEPPSRTTAEAPAGRPATPTPVNRIWVSQELHRFLCSAESLPVTPHLRFSVRTLAVTPDGGLVDGIEVTPETAGRVASRTKQAAWRRTLLLNGRHHANEVASTPAILRFLFDELPASGWQLNVVAVPLENADGASVHARMMDGNRRWKLHAARYNRDGLEYYALYFDPGTVYPEATVVPRLWGAWLPLVYADLHGIPSHEWVQPFAGFNSPPRFPTSFWLPIALIHLIEIWPKHEGKVLNERFLEYLRLRMTRAWSADTRIGTATEVIQGRYRRWAAAWNLDEAFPTHRVELVPLLVHERPLGSPLSFATSYPDVTRAHLVFEVADETATGSYLELCAWADVVGLKALAQAVSEAAADLLNPFEPSDDLPAEVEP